MGAVVTTFCNATNITLYTSLSIIIPIYTTHNLQPGKCVSYSTGRVWFTASAGIESDMKDANLYFPISEAQAGGMVYDSARGMALDPASVVRVSVKMTPDEVGRLKSSHDDIIPDDIKSIKKAHDTSQGNLHVITRGYYANKNKTITISGGPKAIVEKRHPIFADRHIQIVPGHFEPLKMAITDS